MGFSEDLKTITVPANLYRAGVANASDQGLDIISNFGPAIQVKHLSLNQELADEITESVGGNDIVIVCRNADAELIRSLLNQLGQRIRGILTQGDLEFWCNICQTKYRNSMGGDLLNNLICEFKQEFPSLDEIDPFLNERRYSSLHLGVIWAI